MVVIYGQNFKKARPREHSNTTIKSGVVCTWSTGQKKNEEKKSLRKRPTLVYTKTKIEKENIHKNEIQN